MSDVLLYFLLDTPECLGGQCRVNRSWSSLSFCFTRTHRGVFFRTLVPTERRGFQLPEIQYKKYSKTPKFHQEVEKGRVGV